jgi:hypothetical protein
MNIAFIRIIGIVVYLYLVWRNMKDEYDSEKMIAFGWLSFFWFLVGGRAIFGIFNWGVFNNNWMDWLSVWTCPGFSYFGGFVAVLLFAWWYVSKNTWKFYPFLESLTPNFLWLILFLWVDQWLLGAYDSWLLTKILLIILMLFLTRFFRLKYRSWVFYKSGKKGFVFLMTAFVYFLLLSIFSVILKIGVVYSVLYFICSLLFVFQLVILGEICQKK